MILLVEDDAITRAHFADALRSYGYDVMEAGDGVQALEILALNQCDLVIADMVLPRMNGFILIDRIQANWPHTPVIMISGYLSQEAGNKIFGGKVDCLEKPIRPSALVALVQRFCPQSRHS